MGTAFAHVKGLMVQNWDASNDAIRKRIQEALDLRGWDKTDLHEAVAGDTEYKTTLRRLSGETQNLPTPWVAQIAAALDVNPLYLILGQGTLEIRSPEVGEMALELMQVVANSPLDSERLLRRLAAAKALLQGDRSVDSDQDPG